MPLCFLGTALSRDQRGLLQKCATKLHARVVEAYCAEGLKDCVSAWPSRQQFPSVYCSCYIWEQGKLSGRAQADQKVLGLVAGELSSPGPRSGRRTFFSGVTFLC